MDQELIQDFIDEVKELITDLENTLLALEHNREDLNMVSKVFRAMHSIKGASAMFGFDAISDFTHNIEDIYDLVRNQKIPLCNELFNLTLHSVDHIKQILKDPSLSKKKTAQAHEDLKKQIDDFLVRASNNEVGDDDAIATHQEQLKSSTSNMENLKTFYIYFEPTEAYYQNNPQPLSFIDELGKIGNVFILARDKKRPIYFEYEDNIAYNAWEIFISTAKDELALNEVFMFVFDKKTLTTQLIAASDYLKDNGFKEKIIDHSIFECPINIENLFSDYTQYIEKEAIKEKKEEEVPENGDEDESNEDKDGKNSEIQMRASHQKENISSIRVASEKIDEMMNLVSELVTAQAEINLIAEELNNPRLLMVAENIEKLSRRFRDNAFSIALVPLSRSLTRFQRLVRDLSVKFDKEVEFITEGTETEMDKTIIEMMTDPIMHILRNSLDHGIESKEIRKMVGKPEKGTILLKAYYSGANVVIEISDDGAGIDPERVRLKAIEKNLISENDNLSENELINLVFLPGFSTSKDVSDVSGRGVGMDVVRRKIAEIKGQVEIESQINEGTKLIIKLPLTLSIIDGLLVELGKTKYIFPLAAIVKIFEFKHHQIRSFVNNTVLTPEGSFSFIYLRDILEIKGSAPEVERILLIQYKDSQIGLVVDDIIGKYQAVLKPMGKLYDDIDFISGASILGDGSIALVFDPYRIITIVINNII